MDLDIYDQIRGHTQFFNCMPINNRTNLSDVKIMRVLFTEEGTARLCLRETIDNPPEAYICDFVLNDDHEYLKIDFANYKVVPLCVCFVSDKKIGDLSDEEFFERYAAYYIAEARECLAAAIEIKIKETTYES